MARRNRISWPLVGTLAAAVCVGSLAGGYKYFSDKQHDAKFGSADTYVVDLPQSPLLDSQPVSVKKNDLAIATTRPAMTLPQPMTRQPQDQGPSPKPPISQGLAEATPRPVVKDTDARLSPDAAPAYKLSNSSDLFGQADAKIKADDLLGARKVLVAALDAKTLSPADQDEAFKRLSQINETVVFSPRKFLDDPMQVQYVVKPGDNMQKIAAQFGVTWQFIGRLNGIADPKRLQAGKTLKIVKGPFHAVVNKTAFTLDLYQGKPGESGSVFVKRFRVGLGENDSTPTGLWNIDTKLEKPRYYNSRDTGPRTVESGDPTNPLGTRWLALNGQQGQAIGKTSYGIHGTIDPASIGQKKSMGCIRMLNEDVELVYDILITGKSTVTVTE